ncbi:retinol dehydrogenase 12 [Nannochloropsis oceanica]
MPQVLLPRRVLDLLPLTLLSLCIVLVQAGAFSICRMGAAATSGGIGLPIRSALRCLGMTPPNISLLLGRKGGAASSSDESSREIASSWMRTREVRNGYTSDGRRRLLSMAELFASKDSSNEKKSLTDGTFAASGNKNLFSRDGVFKLAGYAAVAYIGKQFFNGGRYDDEPDLSGKVAVITGGNSGIGKETAIRLATLGARVLIACRNSEKGEAAVRDIVNAVSPSSTVEGASRKKNAAPPQVESLVMDLSDLKSIDRFATELNKHVDKVDILVNNAGVMAVSNLERTQDGFERQLGVNHLGHFHLTNRLFDLLLKGAATRDGARIVNVASEAHRFGGLDLQDPNYLTREYKKWEAYGQSKLANILFTRELHRRLAEKGMDKKVLALCCHPGVVRTELGRYLIDDIPSVGKVALAPVALAGWYFTKSPKQGSQTQVYLAASPTLKDEAERGAAVGGTYFSDCRPKKTTKEAEDLDAAGKLWKLSEKLTGSSFSV